MRNLGIHAIYFLCRKNVQTMEYLLLLCYTLQISQMQGKRRLIYTLAVYYLLIFFFLYF